MIPKTQKDTVETETNTQYMIHIHHTLEKDDLKKTKDDFRCFEIELLKN